MVGIPFVAVADHALILIGSAALWERWSLRPLTPCGRRTFDSLSVESLLSETIVRALPNSDDRHGRLI